MIFKQFYIKHGKITAVLAWTMLFKIIFTNLMEPNLNKVAHFYDDCKADVYHYFS